MMKNPLLQATMAGLGAVILYSTYIGMTSDSEVQSPQEYKQDTLNKLIDGLKKDLRENFEIDPPRSKEDGLLTREFMIKMHTLLYRYKKYAFDLIGEANFLHRIVLLREKQQFEEE